MQCRTMRPLLDAFVDGELLPERILEVEQHLADCTRCTEHVRLIEAIRNSTRRTVQADAEPSAAFRARVSAALFAEQERQEEEKRASREHTGMRWTTITPLAAAAMATLAFGAWLNNYADRTEPSAQNPNPAKTTATSMSIEQVLDQLVDYHAAPPAPQITEPSLAERLEPEVGVPVRLPTPNDYDGLWEQYGAAWEGGSVIPVRNQRAAIFRYRLSNHPVTLYVYNASRVQLRAALEPRVVHDIAVHVGARRGYSIAALEQRGVGYAVATDLDDAASAELVAALH